MIRDACNAQKFVQNIGLTIAWKSPYPRLNINRGYIKPGRGGIIVSSLAPRAITESPARRSLRFIFISVLYYYGFCNGGSIRDVSAHIREVRNRRMLHDLGTCSAAHFPVRFFLFFLFFNYDSCPRARPTAPRRFMKSSRMCFHLAHRGCHRTTPMADRVRFDIQEHCTIFLLVFLLH